MNKWSEQKNNSYLKVKTYFFLNFLMYNFKENKLSELYLQSFDSKRDLKQ